MAVSLRPGLLALSASAIVFTAVITPLPDDAPVHATTTVASCAPVELAAASKPLPPGVYTLTPKQVLTVGQALSAAAVTPNLVPTAPLINLANFIDNAYLAIEPWVRYGFELAAYAVSWIPYIGWIIDDQIFVVYNFVESLVHSGVFNVTDWLRGQGTFAKNLADWVVDLGLSLAWLAIDEIGAWVPLPPLNYPPRAPYADLPEGLFGDVIVDASNALARVSNGIWNVWEPIKGGIDNGVAWLSGVLDKFSRVPFVPLINFELNETWKLIATGGDQLTGFAHDMINAGNQFIHDTVKGGGLITATVNAFNTTVASIKARGGASIKAFADWGRAQVDFLVDRLTPGALVAPSRARVAAAGADKSTNKKVTTTAVAPPVTGDATPATTTSTEKAAESSDKDADVTPKKKVRKPTHRTHKVADAKKADEPKTEKETKPDADNPSDTESKADAA